MPDTTYAIASPTVIRMPNSFCAPANRALEVRTCGQEKGGGLLDVIRAEVL